MARKRKTANPTKNKNEQDFLK